MTALTRRRLLAGAAATAATAACGPAVTGPATTAPTVSPTPLPPPETTTIRLPASPAACDPYFWMSDDLLRAEGFTEIERGKTGQTIVNGGQDVDIIYSAALPAWIDADRPIVALAGTHVGCLQLWARSDIGGLRDLRGKRLPVAGKGLNVFYTFWVSMLTSVGIGPDDVSWIVGDYDDTIFTDGRTDAILVSTWAGPLLAQNPKNPGRKIVDTSLDKPWSQYYCCVLVANRDWAQRNPVATKRVTRALLRATDVADKDPASAARSAIDKKLFPARVTYDAMYEFMKDMPMNWRDYDAEETLRYYALRLADGKLIKKTPQEILSSGTDFAYARQLKAELKG